MTQVFLYLCFKFFSDSDNKIDIGNCQGNCHHSHSNFGNSFVRTCDARDHVELRIHPHNGNIHEEKMRTDIVIKTCACKKVHFC